MPSSIITECQCAGWTQYAHEASKTTDVRFKPCRHCGGAACHDTGETLRLCNSCLEDLRNDATQDGKYAIIDD